MAHCDAVGRGHPLHRHSPLGQRSGSGLFENVVAIEMALVVEMVVDRGMDGDP